MPFCTAWGAPTLVIDDGGGHSSILRRMRSGKTGKLTHVTDESVLLDARDGLVIQIVTKAAGKRPKQLPDRYQAARGTHIPIQLLVRDRTAR
jgi:hypothetical protein